MRLTVIHNLQRKEFFYARFHSGYNLGDDWVPISFSLPMSVIPRPELPSGMIRTIEEYELIFHQDEKKITHPKPELDNVSNIMEHYRLLKV